MSAKLTRRQLPALAFAGAGAAAQAQTPASEPSDDTVAKQRLQTNSEALARFDLKMSTEPAFQFKA